MNSFIKKNTAQKFPFSSVDKSCCVLIEWTQTYSFLTFENHNNVKLIKNIEEVIILFQTAKVLSNRNIYKRNRPQSCISLHRPTINRKAVVTKEILMFQLINSLIIRFRIDMGIFHGTKRYLRKKIGEPLETISITHSSDN